LRHILLTEGDPFPVRIAIVFHKNPCGPPTGIDLVRLRAVARGLIDRGVSAEIVAPVAQEQHIEGGIPVLPLEALDQPGRYDLVKTCYHPSIMLLGRFDGPVVSRIVRVVDHESPARDEPFREQLLRCQERIRERAACVVLNNHSNEARWRTLYGPEPDIALVPTGCPRELPPLGRSPFPPDVPAVLFLGSVAAPRMVRMLNEAAHALEGKARIHLVGLNKACMYGGDVNCTLSPLVVDHGELPEQAAWDYIRNASVGLALATGPDPFDNDVSKVLNYLRGGLPVLSEEPILNNDLIQATGLGRVFRYDDLADLVHGALALIQHPPSELRESTMRFMADEHSWDRRVDAYVELFSRIVGPRK
jgi:glycosyltransferase involved in cell wall biosynthesis